MTTQRNRRSARTLEVALALTLALGGGVAAVAATARNSTMDLAELPMPELPPIQGEEYAEIVAPPAVPAPITRDYAARVIVELETIEVTRQVAGGAEYRYWTFGGQVPGNFIRVRQGDEVELRLKNAHNSVVPHNIDLHAVTGPGGGGQATFTGPGNETAFTFRALNPGLYVYHCAVAPMGLHIANGMYGLILVEPKGGMLPVDREFYVMQGEIYAKDGEHEHDAAKLLEFDYEAALDENPRFVVFNGSVGALTGENALRAKVGESVRIFVGNGGPNLVSSFHVVGEIFDNVYQEGGTRLQNNVQTTLVPAGGATIVEFRADVPGTLVMVDHAAFRATDKGALGKIEVTGRTMASIFEAERTSDMTH